MTHFNGHQHHTRCSFLYFHLLKSVCTFITVYLLLYYLFSKLQKTCKLCFLIQWLWRRQYKLTSFSLLTPVINLPLFFSSLWNLWKGFLLCFFCYLRKWEHKKYIYRLLVNIKYINMSITLRSCFPQQCFSLIGRINQRGLQARGRCSYGTSC